MVVPSMLYANAPRSYCPWLEHEDRLLLDPPPQLRHQRGTHRGQPNYKVIAFKLGRTYQATAARAKFITREWVEARYRRNHGRPDGDDPRDGNQDLLRDERQGGHDGDQTAHDGGSREL